MPSYVRKFGGGLRRSDGWFIPEDPANTEYREFLASGASPATEAPPPPSNTLQAAAFLALFTPAEVAAVWAADPRLMAGALKVVAQGTANLSSTECAQLVALAVSKGVLTQARANAVLAGTPAP